MKPLALLAPLATTFGLCSGCATTGQGVTGREDPSITPAQLDLQSVAADDAERSFPQRLSQPRLPAADRLARAIAFEHDGAIAAEVRLCVSPEGKVGDVDLVSSSGMNAFDRAVIDGIADWEYASYAAPTGTRVCEKLTVTYRVGQI